MTYKKWKRLDRIEHQLEEANNGGEGGDEGIQPIPSEVLAKISYIHDLLEPHLIHLEWWGTRCDDEELLADVIAFYDSLPPYPHTFLRDGQVYYYKDRYFPHMLRMYANCTKEWNAASEEERAAIIANCRKQELSYQYGFSASKQPNIPQEQYNDLVRLIQGWDGTKDDLLQILKKAGIKPDNARFGHLNGGCGCGAKELCSSR